MYSCLGFASRSTGVGSTTQKATAEERHHQEQRFANAQGAADARCLELEATASTANLQAERLQDDLATAQGRIRELEQSLSDATEVADRWAAQSRSLSDRLEAATVRSDAISTTAMAAGDHMQTLQSKLMDAEALEQSLRYEIAELKGEVAACQAELERRREEEHTVLQQSKDAAALAQRQLQLQVSDEQHQVTMLRQTEIALRAELDALRTELRSAQDAKASAEQLSQTLRSQSDASRMAASALESSQGRHVSHLSALTAELSAANADRDSLSQELEQAYATIATFERRMAAVRAVHPELQLEARSPPSRDRLSLPPPTPSS